MGEKGQIPSVKALLRKAVSAEPFSAEEARSLDEGGVCEPSLSDAQRVAFLTALYVRGGRGEDFRSLSCFSRIELILADLTSEKGSASSFPSMLKTVLSGASLSAEKAEEAFDAIMSGAVSEVQLASFLTVLHMRGETPEELLGAVRTVRRHMAPLRHVPPNAIDVCGTGGDGLGTLNVSTATAFVLAGLGVEVAKHGGRALSSKAGATDVLEALGIPADGDVARQEQRLQRDHLAFLAAPYHHTAMKKAASVRKDLGFRTLFNLLGPLCNPAGVKRQLVGVFDQRWCAPVADVLGQLGGESIWVVQGETDEGPIDELTLAGPSHISVWEQDQRREVTITPEMAGFSVQPVREVRGGAPQENAQRMEALFKGEKSCYRDTVLLNAAVALHVAGRGSLWAGEQVSSRSLQHLIAQAARSLDDGFALEALTRAQRGVRAQ
ncbi:anthranilate phosphoribosyltransferase [Saccharibacter floricola DSM 15669]|uniref:Anthranilate phosphoribosyltransferase n=2 Tax=Saccharibacter TaxID=231052 RepID=A0ABQ0NZZ0_9PROT|nr:anthranilate phosphoribosyltransferase [Saccharibacter floricola DSM 15669]